MVELVRRILLVVPLACLCTTARAQTVVSPPDEVHQSAGGGLLGIRTSLDGALLMSSGNQPPSNQPVRRDSLWNGTLIGLGVGAMTGALVGLSVTDSERYGFNVPLTLGVIGAGIGAGVGAGIDAARGRPAPSPHRDQHVRLSPFFTEKTRGLMAWIRF